MKILVSVPLGTDGLERILAVAPGAQIAQMGDPRKLTELPADVDDAEVLFTDFCPDWLGVLPGLRWVQLRTAGSEHLAGSLIWGRHEVALTTGNGIAADSIAAYVFGMIVRHAHRLDEAMAIKSRRGWTTDFETVRAATLTGRTLGLVGYGAIGRRIAAVAVALGMNVRAVSRSGRASDSSWTPGSSRPNAPRDQVELADLSGLADLLRVSDYVVVSVPRTTDTIDLIGPDQLALMKPTALLLNVGRGGTVNERALVAALQSGQLAGAILDVMSKEPLPLDSPLYDTPGLVITPHVAGFFDRFADFAVELFLENLGRYRSGRELFNQVDRGRGY